MFAEPDGVFVGGVRVEVAVGVTPSLDFLAVGAQACGDGACDRSWLELLEQAFRGEAPPPTLGGHQSRDMASVSYTSSPHSSRKNSSTVCSRISPTLSMGMMVVR